MSKNLYIDPVTYDLALTATKNLRLTSDEFEYFTQKIEAVLSVFQGEWFLDRSKGIPYYQSILKKIADLDDISNIFYIALSDIPGVVEILKFEFDYDNNIREYSLEFEVRVDSGEIITGSI